MYEFYDIVCYVAIFISSLLAAVRYLYFVTQNKGSGIENGQYMRKNRFLYNLCLCAFAGFYKSTISMCVLKNIL